MRPIQLHGHERPLTQLKYNKDGDLLFSCARDKSPNVWFAHNGERLGSFDGHNGAVFSLDVNFDTRWLLTASADQTAKLWDIERGSELFTFEFKTPVR
jgi:translation initiation factor 3 subunit I